MRPTIDDVSSRLASAGHKRAPDEDEPEDEADEQEDLPEAADVDVFPALVPEPEVAGEAELLHHRRTTVPRTQPTTITTRQMKRKLTPRRWNLGSCPEIAGR
jgi:hypothetical protein